MRRQVLLVEPWYGGSHKAWADGWRQASRHRIDLLTHEPQLWRWRMRGSAVTLAELARQWVDESGEPDALVVSGLTNLAVFLGLTRSELATVPVLLYLHENQLTYPPGRSGRGAGTDMAWVNWQSLMAADRVLCNSHYHRASLLAALPALVDQAEDRTHHHLLRDVEERIGVLHVGIDLAGLDQLRPPSSAPPLVLWNHRWDHDKGPDELLGALLELEAAGVDYRLALAGHASAGFEPPDALVEIQRRFEHRLAHVGELTGEAYRDLLLCTDIVVSTARHETFGVAVAEAIAAGAVPLLPDRLSYPELVPTRHHAEVLYRPGELGVRLIGACHDLDAARRRLPELRSSMNRFSWEVITPRYDDEIEALCER